MTLLLGTGILKPKKVVWSRQGQLAFLFPCGLLPPLPCLAAPLPLGFPDSHQHGPLTVAVAKPFTLSESYSLLSQGASPRSWLPDFPTSFNLCAHPQHHHLRCQAVPSTGSADVCAACRWCQ